MVHAKWLEERLLYKDLIGVPRDLGNHLGEQEVPDATVLKTLAWGEHEGLILEPRDGLFQSCGDGDGVPKAGDAAL
jgi:hypothetical protein